MVESEPFVSSPQCSAATAVADNTVKISLMHNQPLENMLRSWKKFAWDLITHGSLQLSAIVFGKRLTRYL